MVAIVVVGIGRLVLSLAGVSNDNLKWLSLTLVAFLGVLYCAIEVPRRGFGSYRHLLPLYFMQSATANFIIAGSILLSVVTGKENIYSAPEYSGPLASSQMLHALGHIADGLIIGPLAGWIVGSFLMWIVKRLLPAKTARAMPAGHS